MDESEAFHVDGSVQRLFTDARFVKLLTSTRRKLVDSAGMLQGVSDMKKTENATVQTLLLTTLGIAKVLRSVASRRGLWKE